MANGIKRRNRIGRRRMVEKGKFENRSIIFPSGNNIFLIVLIITMSIIFGGNSISAATIEKTVNVIYFFPKNGTQNPSGNPNWFYYWSQGLSLSNLTYNAGTNWGMADPATNTVYIGDNAGYGPDPRHGLTGIDCFYTIASHELRHLADFIAIRARYGVCCGPGTLPIADDPDRDGLPSFLDPYPNKVNGAGLPEYSGVDAWQGDWEYRARQGEPNIASPDIDWAHPGKQWP